MNFYEGIFPIGLGTNHLPIQGAGDTAGIEKSAKLVLTAIENGVNYIDTAHIYSKGMAHQALKLAFKQTKQPYNVTLKSGYYMHKNADGARRQSEASLEEMGISKASFFVCWSIKSFTEFQHIMGKNGIYEAALKLRGEGLIEHIIFSTHAPVPDILKILNSKVFEGVVISFSVLNSTVMLPVLETADRLGVGVIAMNPLGGGIIPQNKEYFKFLTGSEKESTVQAALRYVSAHPAIKVSLIGPSNIYELNENLTALDSDYTEINRVSRVNSLIRVQHGFCTGCGYCKDCPSGTDIPAFMQSRNALLFNPVKAYNRSDTEVLRNIQLFKRLYMDFDILPETDENPCIGCGQCEKKCTQSLEIMNALDDFYRRVKESSFSQKARKERLAELFMEKPYKKVGFYPSGGYTIEVLKMYKEFFGEPEFECVLFDSNPSQWGKFVDGIKIFNPDEINLLNLDAIIVSNFIYTDEIYHKLQHHQINGLEIYELHEANDVPWVF